MAWINFKDKKIFLQVETVNGLWNYQGHCDDVVYMGKNIEGVELYFLEITDITNKKVGFSSTQIKFIKEEK